MEYKKNKKRLSPYDQKRIAFIVRERKRKYEQKKKIYDKESDMEWKEK